MAYPIVYELNTRCWLGALSRQAGQTVTLANVPESELARWRALGITHVWLMGVWTTGPRSRAQSLNDPHQQRFFAQCLPDWREEDVAGSPFAIAAYQVPEALGGEAGLARCREKLRAHGLKLLLDFVPNHLGLDHPLTAQRPELFVQAPGEHASAFLQEAGEGLKWLAHGRDPNFPAWIDTAQLDYRRADTRAVMTEVLQSVAARCDGVRCDMAMLLLADVFAKTWQDFPGSVPIAPNEFWADAIRAVKAVQPGFVFLAEAYWDLEARLQELGFDFTYDKRVYDYLVARRPWEVQRHLLNAAPEFLGASAHFLENHDEARIAASLSLAEHRAAALLVLGLPGLRLLHEGQLEGARRQARVQLQRRAVEAPDPPVTALYEQLLAALGKSSVGTGQGLLLQPTQAWADNYTARNFIIVQWQANAPEFDLVVVNLAAHDSQCYAPLRIAGLAETNWELEDRLGPEKYRRRGDDLQAQGLYLDVPAHAAQLFHFRPIG